jgi:hypothetical protein
VEGGQPPLDLLGQDGRVTPVAGRRTHLAAGLLGLAVLSGSCAALGGSAAAPSSPGTAEAGQVHTRDTVEDAAATVASESRSAGGPDAAPSAAPPEPPQKRACYRLRPGQLTRPTNDSVRVACRGRHTATTIAVGRIDSVVDGHLLAVDARHVQRRIARTCPRRLDDFLGGDPEARALSRFAVVWFSPTVAQNDRGADWFRCDVVAFAGADTLLPLPPPGRLKGILDDEAALDRFGLCGTAAPGAKNFSRVACARRHSWRAVSTIPLDGDSYPGRQAVREAGDAPCRDQVRALAGAPDRFRYGWEWPTRAQWRRGQHHGFCWAPA